MNRHLISVFAMATLCASLAAAPMAWADETVSLSDEGSADVALAAQAALANDPTASAMEEEEEAVPPIEPCPEGEHVAVIDPAVDPTYTTTGLTEGSHCEVCGAVLVAQETVAQLALAAPASVKTANAASGIKVTWKKVAGAQKYVVYRDGEELATTTAVSYLDKTAKANAHRYRYRVVAYAGSNKSSASAASYQYRLTKVASKTALTRGARFTYRWTPAASAQKVTGYQVRVSKSSAMTNCATRTIKGASAKSKLFKISKNRANVYYAQVRSYRVVSGKTYYSAWSGVRKINLGTPKALKAKVGIKGNFHSSLYHGKKPAKYQKYIVIHDTEGGGVPDNVIYGWVANGNLVAAHYVIGRDGSISQCVPLNTIAHHAGYGNTGHNKSFGIKEDGRDDMRGSVPIGSQAADYGMNAWSVGIELIHVHGQNYTTAQLETLDKLIRYIDAYYGFESSITDHKAWRSGNSDTDSTFAGYFANYKKYRSYKKMAG